jgi:SAM-dependent methyltransferase
MNTNGHSDPTIDYYQTRAADFVRETLAVDMTALYEPFLALVQPGGHILDAGCGSGRDAREFKRRGFTVTAFDASPELARLAAGVIGQPVEVLRFQEMSYEDKFDGVWSCASLLHVPEAEMESVLARVARALRAGGAWYLSFKEGEGEVERDGRRFTCYTEQSLARLLNRVPAIGIVSIWRTPDVRPGRGREKWVNALIRKQPLDAS